MKKFIFSLLTIIVLVSCSKENPNSDGRYDERVEIKVSSQALEIVSRSPYEGNIVSNKPLRTFIPVSSDQGDYTTPYEGSHGYMQFSDNGISAVGFVDKKDWETSAAKHYPANASKVYLCGLFPHDAWGTAPKTTAEATFDGKTDLMAAKEIATTKEDVQTGGLPKTLEFKHLLTQLRIKPTAENADAKNVWGDITSLKLIKVGENDPANQAIVTLASGEVKFGGENATNCYTTNDEEISNDQPLTLEISSSIPTAYTLCQPVNASTGTNHYTLEIITTGHQTPYIIPLTLEYKLEYEGNKTSTAGQAFEITLTFKTSTIQAKATIDQWKDAGTSEGIIQ